jgi:cysteine desulfurase
VHLDYNATTPVDSRVVAAAVVFWRGDAFGNPSSDHAYGSGPCRALEDARSTVAALIGARACEIVFTGSGSEADQLAIRGPVLARLGRAGGGPSRVITQATEHRAVLATYAALAGWHGTEIVTLPVDRQGLLDPALVAETPAARHADRGVGDAGEQRDRRHSGGS